MDYTVKKLPKSEIQITVTVSDEMIKICRKKAAEDLSKDVKIKGFRPGKAPLHVIEQYIEPQYIDAHAKDLAMQRSYADAVTTEKLHVISRPKVEIKSEEPFTFVATVATMPEVELKDHKSIKVKKDEVKVDDKEVEEVLDNMRKQGTVYKDIDRAAKKDDRVEVDFEGFDEKGKTLEGTKSANHPLVLGSDMMIPGFEDEMLGLKKGDKKEFNITFPKDYHKKDFQKKKVTFKVEMKRVEEPKAPELNEEFFEKMTGKKQKLDDIKKQIVDNIKAKKEEEAAQKQENDYIEALLKKTKVEVPDSLIEEEAQNILHDMKHQLEHRGQKWEDFIARAKTTEEELLKKYRKEAERRIKIRLALQELIKQEGIKVSEDEIKKEVEHMKSHYPESEQKKIEEEFKSGELAVQIANKLTLNKLFKKVL